MSLLIHFFSFIDAGGLPTTATDKVTFKTMIGVASAIIGGLSLVIITVSGLRYIVANGDPQKISKAKNGIVYSLVGLIIAISAETIVAFVVNKL